MIKKEYLEFVKLRDAGRIPPGVTWEKWKTMPAEERDKAAGAAA